jgi:hypothetical protein
MKEPLKFVEVSYVLYNKCYFNLNVNPTIVGQVKC